MRSLIHFTFLFFLFYNWHVLEFFVCVWIFNNNLSMALWVMGGCLQKTADCWCVFMLAGLCFQLFVIMNILMGCCWGVMSHVVLWTRIVVFFIHGLNSGPVTAFLNCKQIWMYYFYINWLAIYYFLSRFWIAGVVSFCLVILQTNAATIAVKLQFWTPQKPWCCSQNHGCRPFLKPFFLPLKSSYTLVYSLR